MKKHITLQTATHAEAIKRIDAVIQPYLENMHSLHEAGIKGILAEIKVYLYDEFEDFGFEFHDLLTPEDPTPTEKEENTNGISH